MARIRTIKPEFFTSADICRLSMPARLLYIATWLEADREGRLKWSPHTWRLRYFPADHSVNIEALADELIQSALILRYGGEYAYIPSFPDHQCVNGRESESRLPDPVRVGTRGHASRTRHDASARVTNDPARVGTRHSDPATCTDGSSFPFLPNDLDLDQDPDPDSSTKAETRRTRLTEAFDAVFWPAYPRKVAKAAALKAWITVRPDAALIETMLAALTRQRALEAWQRDGGAYIPHAATWLRGRRWEDVDGVPAGTSAQADAERERTLNVIRERKALLQGRQMAQEGRTA